MAHTAPPRSVGATGAGLIECNLDRGDKVAD